VTTRRRLAALLVAVLTIVLTVAFLGIAFLSDFSGQHRVNPASVGVAVAVAITGTLLVARIVRSR
jgi:hypothetical protein